MTNMDRVWIFCFLAAIWVFVTPGDKTGWEFAFGYTMRYAALGIWMWMIMWRKDR